jgi:Leucine-rich repeat (LRR) protein
MNRDELIHIFGFLNRRDLMNASLVNTTFNKASNHFGIWKGLCERKFPTFDIQHHFKETYIKYYTLNQFLWSIGTTSADNAMKEREIYLNDRSINSIPEEIELLTNLRTLEITTNNLTKIPNGIGNLTNLKRLDLSGNYLREIPRDFSRLINLTEINVNRNKIQIFPQQFCFLTNLTIINISHNELTIITHDISLLQKLNILTLDNNLLCDLPKELGLLTNLTRIDLEYNPFKRSLISLKTLSNLDSVWINSSNEILYHAKYHMLSRELVIRHDFIIYSFIHRSLNKINLLRSMFILLFHFL